MAEPPSDPHLDRMVGRDDPNEGRPATRKRPPTPKRPRSKSDPVKVWEARLTRANKTYDAWHERYEVSHLDDYYEGRHWRGSAENEARKKYVINMVFATVETQLPALLFSKPKVQVEARPGNQETATSQAGARATLIEQALQTFIDDPKIAFLEETTLGLRDAYSRFGVVEVGYTGDWIDNPNADKPILKEDGNPVADPDAPDGAALVEPKRLPKPGMKESLYVRHIPAWTVRVGSAQQRLVTNDWVAYYEWLPLEDVKRNTQYENTHDLQASGSLKPSDDQHADLSDQEDADAALRHGQVKLWKIWDLRAKVRHVLAEGHKDLLQENEPFTFCPLAVLKFFERRNSFYPLPPIYNWMSPQDEINETREMQKVHRRRALRRYMAEPQVTKTEKEKLETAEDMVIIEVPKVDPPPIVPIQDAPLDPQNWTELAATRQDLNEVAGVSGETRGTPNAPTATQANIANTQTSIRESHARQQVGSWLASIARLMLLTMRERMKLPFMVKRSLDPFAAVQDEALTAIRGQLWQEIETEDIDTLDVDITIDIASLSPVAEEARRNQWNTILQLLTNPALATLLMTPNPRAPDEPSPLLRKTLTLNGVTSDQEIREIWRVGQALLQQQAAAAASQAALSKQPEPMKLTLSLKGDDFSNPIIGPMLLQIFAREENLPIQAAQTAVPMPATAGVGEGSGGLSIPKPPGATAGTPSQGVSH